MKSFGSFIVSIKQYFEAVVGGHNQLWRSEVKRQVYVP